MSKVAKFVLIIMESAQRIEKQALEFYSKLLSSEELGKQFVKETLSLEQLLKIQNDFSVEIVMVEENQNYGSFIKLNSSRLYNENKEGKKPLGIEQIVYFNTEELALLFDRIKVIATQRKNDLIWIKVLEVDTILQEFLESIGYKTFNLENQTQSNPKLRTIYYRK